ncbi:MAG: cupin domain-containing protein [Dehalococcoidia bacterium]|nr:cupin domain-containing protein [Dehalococcoidia bacterium]
MGKTMGIGPGNSKEKGQSVASFYEKARRSPQVMKPHEIPWEDCGQGRKKDLVKAVKPVLHTMDASIHILPPGACSDRHRHMAEELVYVLEGSGYDLHWEAPVVPRRKGYTLGKGQPTRYDWQQGDTIYVPVNVEHQHVNHDVERPARFICATSRIPDYAVFDRLEDSPPVTAG